MSNRYLVAAGALAAIFAVALLVFALLSLDAPSQALMYIIGAALAAIAFKHWLSTWIVRVLAVGTACMLYWFFGQFFLRAEELMPGWYASGDAIPALGLLVGGFGMIPVLSEYSCRMKASGECERARRQFEERKPVFNALRASESPRSVL